MVESTSAVTAASTPPSTAVLYEVHFDFVWKNLRRLGVPDAQLEDAVHDVFGVVHRRRDTFDGRSRVQTWIYGILRRVASHHRRREQRHQRRLVAVSQEPEVREAAEEGFVRREELRLVETFLRALDPPKREVFVLAHLEQMQGREIAELLDINPNTASARLRAARGAFAQFVREHELGEDALGAAARGETAPPETKRRVLAGLLPMISTSTEGQGSSTGAGWGRLAMVSTGVAALVFVGAAGMGSPTDAPSPSRGASGQPETHAVSTPDAAPDNGLEPPSEALAERASPRPLSPPIQVGVPSKSDSGGVVPSEPSPDTSLRSSAGQVGGPKGPSVAGEARRVEPKAVVGSSPKPTAPDSTAPPAQTLAEQTRLARRVRADDDPEMILERVREYEKRFADGFFAERLGFEALAALCRLGRTEAARKRVAQLRARYPRSTLLPPSDGPCVGQSSRPGTKVGEGGDARE